MRRIGNLFDRILARGNLREATYRAMKGKRSQSDARRFCEDLDTNLERLADGVRDRTIVLGESHQFWIHDPKPRLITAASFRERVLHHAIMALCEPVFEHWLIADTYACRVGLGRDKALLRAREFSGRTMFLCQMDVRKFFPSIPQDELFRRLCRLFKDEPLLDLFSRVLGGDGGVPVQCGLPIGSLTSQHFANFYLGWLDRFVKEQLRVRGYVRYMDDFVLWGDCREELKEQWQSCRDFLWDELKLELKRRPSIRPTDGGLSFLGCRVFDSHVELNRRSRRRFRHRLRELTERFAGGQITERELQERATALVAFTRCGAVRSWQFRQEAIESVSVSGHEPRTA